MKAVLKINLGSKVLEIGGEGKDTDIIKNLSFWSSLPTECSACKSKNIGLLWKNPKGNDYYGLKCCECSAEFTFHQLKTGGFYITKDDTWKKWQSNGGTKTETMEEDYQSYPAKNTDETF